MGCAVRESEMGLVQLNYSSPDPSIAALDVFWAVEMYPMFSGMIRSTSTN